MLAGKRLIATEGDPPCAPLIPFVRPGAEPVIFEILPLKSARVSCDCCGAPTRMASGMVQHAGPADPYGDEGHVASYPVRMTDGRLFNADHPGRIELIFGPLREDAPPETRFSVMLEATRDAARRPILTLVDAPVPSPDAPDSALRGAALTKQEAMASPLAPQVFAIADAIIAQDRSLGPIG